MSNAQQHIAAIRDALKRGPTPGPWRYWLTAHGARVAGRPADGTKNFVCDVLIPELAVDYEDNARLIAVCNPEAMRAILAYIEALEADAERLNAVVDSLVTSLSECVEYVDEAIALNDTHGESYRPHRLQAIRDEAARARAAIDAARKEADRG